MSIKFVGDEPTNTQRVLTNDYLLDKALMDRRGNKGVPLRSLMEIYGKKGVGKTTFGTWLAGLVAREMDTDIDYCDLEGQSRETLEDILEYVGFHNTVNMVMMQAGEDPEKMIVRWLDACMKNENMAVFDAIGAYTSTAEFKGKLTDRNMGERAFVMGRVAGRLIRYVAQSETGRIIIMLNHEHPNLGAMARGTITGGGEKKKYLSHVRIRLTDGYLGKSLINYETSYLLKGKVDNNRYGFDKGVFYPFVIKGEGVHLGLTSMFECIATKVASVSADSIGLGTSVKMDGTNYGKIGEIIADRNKFNFLPFLNALKQADAEASTDEEVEEDAEAG